MQPASRPDPDTATGSHRRTTPHRRAVVALGALASVALHGLVAFALARVKAPPPPAANPVVFEVREAPAPKPEPKVEAQTEPEPEPEPEPPPTPPRPRVRKKPPPRELSMRSPYEAPTPTPDRPPPPSNAKPEEPPPKTVKPKLGVTEASTVEGESSVAVPVGNTTMMAPPQAPSEDDEPAEPYAGGRPSSTPGTSPFAPVPAGLIGSWPEVRSEVKADYPDEALRLGIEGTVRLRVDIDPEGRTHAVRVVRKLGHGLDKAAVAAVRRFRWRPARGHDGRPVPVRINYAYTFRLPL